MTLTIQPVVTRRDIKRFVTFPWRIYRGDPNWVPPLIDGQMDKLTPGRNPFWEHAERALWLATDDDRPVGTIAAIIDHAGNRALGQTLGSFGFFECVNDQPAARLLLDTAAEWLAARGMTAISGPYNPSANDDPGLLVEGYDTRPALMEGHTPPYYIELVEAAGFHKLWDTVAWLALIPPGTKRLEDVAPPKLLRTIQWAANRSQARLRPVDLAHWESDVSLACAIYNAALAHLPNFIPTPEAEFQQLAASFKPLIDRDLAFFAEVHGEPVAFAITLPDLNEALQHVNGRLGPIGMAKLWWHSRHLHRATFKILMIRPEFRGRGLESLLLYETARVIFDRGYREVDMSLTGEDNENMQRMMAGMEMQVYRRYRVYEKEIGRQVDKETG